MLESTVGAQVRRQEEGGEGGGGESVVVPIMEIYPILSLHMICVLHYGNRKQRLKASSGTGCQ